MEVTRTQLNNRYQVLESLGRGGFGETFLAVDTHLPSGRKCVIKQLKPAIESPMIPEWLKERFQREAAILESLGENNPYIPQLYAYFSENNNFYLVQEWIEGLTLTQLQNKKGKCSPSEVKEILEKILSILDYIHGRRIIHRDIKPDNIILRSHDQLPVLIDFGIMKEAIATYVDPNGKTAYSVALGTPGYMSSEQAAGRPVYSSDLYSLGLTAIFLLTGKSPQYLDHDCQTGEIIWRNLVPNLPNAFAATLDRAIRFHPRDRFTSAKEMLAALKSSMGSVPTAATEVILPQTDQISISATQEVPLNNLEEESKTFPWWQWFILPILTAGLILGTFILGFNLFINRNPRFMPSQPLESPSPESFPTPLRPTPPPTFTPEIDPTPTPELTPTPIPELTPTPEVSPTPTASPTPTPDPDITPLYPEPIIPPGAELTPLTPIPDSSPDSSGEVMPNPLVPSPVPSEQE